MPKLISEFDLIRKTLEINQPKSINQEAEEVKPITPMVVAEKLSIPWELVFLPGGEMLVTERPGRLLRIGTDKVIIEITGVAHTGEGGLLGLALDPRFSENGLVYLYLTTQSDGNLTNRVERYKLEGATLSERKVVIEGIPGASYHDGGRIAFGPSTSCESGQADCMLYITTGDAGTEDSAQDTKSLAGKILRIHSDGSIPSDNPFDFAQGKPSGHPAVYSYGHRNVQGITWDENGQLWATEHGRSGGLSGFDEVNRIVKGGNYGWPKIQGNESYTGMLTPHLNSGASETWAPSGMAYLDEHLIFAGLRGESLYTADTSSGMARDLKKYLVGAYGRLRTVTVGPDGMLYILTNNRDGRGEPVTVDDRIIKIDPKTLGL
jgi:glucose/arabinose dehydrogenase